MTTKAAPEPNGPRFAHCRHCEEMIRQERRSLPWYHVGTDSEEC